jgi:hypothetical protein
MLRNNLTNTFLMWGYVCICVTCVTLYKYMNKNKGLAGYTRGYTRVTQWPQRLHCVPGEVL